MPRFGGFLIGTALLCAGSAHAEDWGPLQFLMGSWAGEGDGSPGRGSGAISFSSDLQGKILVRKNFAEYPAANGKPASRHEDLMIVYREGSPERLRAMYFDSENHTIAYAVEAREGGVVFVSEGGKDTPRYRMTYARAGADELSFRFEIAAPEKDFAKYIEAKLHRDKR